MLPGEFDIAHSVVSREWKSFKTTECVVDGPGGRVRSTTPAENRYIVPSAKKEQAHHSSADGKSVSCCLRKADLPKNCCQTFEGRSGLYARRPVVCVPLTRQHRTARLQWCREHHNSTEQDWHAYYSQMRIGSVCHRIVDAN
ncbi:transposable element Tcb2 transposase [Trichonephila clavipes]|nr:transposable element Tcb2 transposase [Trichonephila clavipes]